MRVFERDTYLSDAAGASKRYRHSVDLTSTLGQAKTLIVELNGHRRSSSAQATVKVWANSVPLVAPSEGGGNLGLPITATTLRPAPLTITGPFAGLVEVTLDIAASAGGNVEEFDLEVWVTLILEE